MLTDHHPPQNRSGRRVHQHHSGRSGRAQSKKAKAKISGRLQEIAHGIAEMEAVDRLAIRHALHRRRRQLLSEQGYTPDEIDRIEDLRLGVTYHVMCAMAQCSRVWIDDGTLQVDGSRAEQFARRLNRYNAVLDGHDHSLAAVVYQRLTGGRHE